MARMSKVRAFGSFWLDFVVGDDWRIAALVVVALGATALLVAAGVNAWWLVPACVAVVVPWSVWQAARAATKGHDG